VTVGSDWDIIWSDNNGDDFLKVDETNDALVLGSTGGTTEREVNFAGKVGTNIVFDGTAGRTLTNAQTMTVSTTGANLLSLTGGGGITSTSTGGAYTVTATAQAVTIDGAGISIDGTSASNVTVTAGDLTLSTATSGNVDITAADDINLAAAGSDIDMDAATLTVDMTGAISLDSVGTSNWTNSTGNLTISTTTSGTLAVTSVAALDMDGTVVTLDASSGFSIDGTGASNVTATSGDLTLSTGTTGNVDITAADDINLAAAGSDIDMDAATLTVDMTGAISLDSVGTSNWNNSTGNLTIATTTSGTLAVTGVAALDMDGTVVTLDGSTSVAIDSAGTTLLDSATGTTVSADAGGVTIDATAGNIAITAPAASDVNITATSDAASDVNFAAHGLTIPFNATTSTALNTTAQDIIGALNELKAESSDMVITYNAAVDIAFGEMVYLTGTGTVGLAESATNVRAIGVSVSAGTITTGNPVNVAVGGEVRVIDVVGTPDEGKYVYLSSTGGALTCTAPGTGTILRVGILTNATSSAMTMVVQPGTPVSL